MLRTTLITVALLAGASPVFAQVGEMGTFGNVCNLGCTMQDGTTFSRQGSPGGRYEVTPAPSQPPPSNSYRNFGNPPSGSPFGNPPTGSPYGNYQPPAETDSTYGKPWLREGKSRY